MNEAVTKYILSVLIGVVIVCCVHSSGLALTNEVVYSQFQFNFITPGARATALGGAFIGLADDATAVELNPAGLTVLTAPEVSIELKHTRYTTEQIYANPRNLANINPETGVYETDITRKEFDVFVESVPFVSAVYPYKRIVLSLYRQELVNYKSSYRTSAEPITIPGTNYSFFPIDASVELTVTNYGIGTAVQLFEELSVAVSSRWSEMKMKSHSSRFDGNQENASPDPTDFSDDDILWGSRIDDRDIGFSVNAGVLWKPHPRVSIGAVYRNGAKFKVKAGSSAESYNPDNAEFTLNVPDSFGAGVAFRISDFLTFTLDVVHIRYEDLLEDFDIVGEAGVYTKENYIIDNATEVHVGVEYILALSERFLALRAGIYNDPDHTIRFTGTTGETVFDIAGREKFSGGEDQIHITGGAGLVVNEHFQIDTAANFADKMKQLSVSVVYRF